MEVKIDSYKPRQISIFVYDLQDPKSAKFAMDVKMDSFKSVSVKVTTREAKFFGLQNRIVYARIIAKLSFDQFQPGVITKYALEKLLSVQ